MLKDGAAKLRNFCKSVASDPSLVEVALFNVAGNCFVISFGLAWHVVVIDIIWRKAIQRHMRPPSVVPVFEFVTQFSQMVNSLDDGNPFEPFVFQGFVGSFGDRDRTVFTDGSQARFDKDTRQGLSGVSLLPLSSV